MNKWLVGTGFWCSLLASQALFAQAVPTFPQLDPSQIDSIFKTVSAGVAFRPVQPASNPSLWGVSLGVAALQSSTSQIQSLIGTGTPYLYDAEISGSVSGPFGLGVEVGVLPGMTISGVSVSRLGLDVKWTFTDLFFSSLPLSAAIRAMYTNAYLSYGEALNGGTVNITYNTNLTGANLSVSKSFIFVEPYLSYGVVQHSSTISGTGTASLFNNNFPAGTTSASGTGSSGWFQAGVQFKLGFFTLAGEYDNLFSADSFAGRLAFSF